MPAFFPSRAPAGGRPAAAGSLALAERLALRCIAFPAISTGVYGYPRREAAQVAVDTVRAHAAHTLARVVFCRFGPADLALHEQLHGAPPQA